MGIFNDFETLLTHFLREIYGIGFDQDVEDKNYVIKYLMKSFPITSQLSSYMPLYAPELAKELGIQQGTQPRLLR
jgi:hypothetical protein